MSAKHTPGPWFVSRGNPDFPQVATIALTEDGFGYRGDGTGNYVCVTGVLTDADARLIAAAPDLLASLQDLYAMALRNDTPTEEQVRRMEAAQLAIAKATGGAS